MIQLAFLCVAAPAFAVQEDITLPPVANPRRVPIVAAADPPQVLEMHFVGDLTGWTERDRLKRAITSDDTPFEERCRLLDEYTAHLIEARDRKEGDELLATIRALIQPPLAAEQEAQALRLVDGSRLELNGTGEQQAWLSTFLTERRLFVGYLQFDVRILDLAAGSLKDLGPGLGEGVYSSSELDAFVAAHQDCNRVVAPTVVTRPGEKASLSVLNQHAYIRDYEVHVFDRDQYVVDPVIDVLQSGLSLDLRAAPMGAGRLAVHVDLTLSDAQQPFPERKVKVGPLDTEVTVQMPVVDKVHAVGRFDVRPGNVAVLALLDPKGVKALGLGGDGEPLRREVIAVVRAAVLPGDNLPSAEHDRAPQGGRR